MTCFVDKESEGTYENCCLDYKPSDCEIAEKLFKKGKTKKDCEYWREPISNICTVSRNPGRLKAATLCRLMDDCLPEQIEDEKDMQEFINKLWPALCCELEVKTA